MKTLVIHPADPTTDFLKPIYADLECDMIRSDFRDYNMIPKMKKADHIIMMGHGSPAGLMNIVRTAGGIIAGYGNVVSSKHVYLLREKLTTCIWCNANSFVEKYNLYGLYTGMIISEADEAVTYSVAHHPQWIEESNELFTKAMTVALATGLDKNVRKMYKNPENPIINFNSQNIYYRRKEDLNK